MDAKQMTAADLLATLRLWQEQGEPLAEMPVWLDHCGNRRDEVTERCVGIADVNGQRSLVLDEMAGWYADSRTA